MTRIIETWGVNQYNRAIADGIEIDGGFNLIGLGLLSVTDAYILVASECLDKLKVVYSEIRSPNGLCSH
jgi:hypothetical protein